MGRGGWDGWDGVTKTDQRGLIRRRGTCRKEKGPRAEGEGEAGRLGGGFAAINSLPAVSRPVRQHRTLLDRPGTGEKGSRRADRDNHPSSAGLSVRLFVFPPASIPPPHPSLLQLALLAFTSSMTSTSRDTIPIGTRKSALAIAQTVQVQVALQRLNPDKSFPLLQMTTTGDNNQIQPLSSIGTTAVFTRELENALEREECHILVHSLKDVPTQIKPGFVIGAMMKREDPNDVMVMRPGEFKALKDFGPNDVVGTSSVRRASQIRRLCPGVQVMDVVGVFQFFYSSDVSVSPSPKTHKTNFLIHFSFPGRRPLNR